MAGVSYLYINLAALCCYVLLLVAFLAAKKTPEIKGFLLVLVGFTLWVGASILMRMEVYPGLSFWFYVSLVALFALGLVIYLFVLSFANKRQPLITALWTIGTLAILTATVFGVFLKPPTVELTEGGKLFRYSMTWHIAIPYCFLMCIVVSIARIFHQLIREKGTNMPGLRAIIAGCVAVGLGNILQIIPGNAFPWDQLSGILFAALLLMGLYKKRMFTMTLLVSRNVLLTVSCVVAMVLLTMFISPLRSALASTFGDEDTLTVFIVVLFSLLAFLFYVVIRRIFNVLYSIEEQQNRQISDFSDRVSKTLDSDEIVSALIDSLSKVMVGSSIYVCLRQEDDFIARGSSSRLSRPSFAISQSNPCIASLSEAQSCIVMDEFRRSPLYRSMWGEEKALLAGLDIGCIIPLKDDGGIEGLVLLTKKEKGSPYSNGELDYVCTISAVASIALKNAKLYEQVYREARIDSLTGVFNYRAFMEKAEDCFRKYGAEALALLNIDIDDFNLYNQLYGTLEGDRILTRTAEIIKGRVGGNGMVFRTGGKIFSVLLPLWDGRRAHGLAEEIKAQIAGINAGPDREGSKLVTASVGICVSPMAASTAKELIHNAGLAVYAAKNGGKDRIVVRAFGDMYTKNLRERVNEIMDSSDPAYEGNSLVISALTAAIDAKDHYTCQHSRNVAFYATMLALYAGLSEEEAHVVYQAGILHDIGKISIPEHILSKTSSLTAEEYAIMKGHVINSIEMIRHLPAMDYLVPAAVGHHERWDGKGYPRGIAGKEIPVTARCLAVADAFDAMTTDRPYHKGLSAEYASVEIQKNAGTQFDPILAEKFVELVQAGQISLTAAASAAFAAS